MAEIVVSDRIAQLRKDTDPRSIGPTLAMNRPRVMQFAEPLPNNLLDAAAEALAEYPEVNFRVYGSSVDPSLSWLKRFDHIRSLSVDLWHVTDFSILGSLKHLRLLSLGETLSKRPSLGFLRHLPELEVLRIEAHDRDFAAIGQLHSLRELHLRTPRVKSLECLHGHPRLEVFAMDFGGIRDLSPLGSVPHLRALQLYLIRKFDTADFDAVGACNSLLALSLGALRHVRRLTALTRGPRETMRYLTLERMTGLDTLADLARCDALEQVHITESKPKDERLDLVAGGKRLRDLVIGDHYPKAQLELLKATFRGETLWVHGTSLRGDPALRDVEVSWRRPIESYLELADRDREARRETHQPK